MNKIKSLLAVTTMLVGLSACDPPNQYAGLPYPAVGMTIEQALDGTSWGPPGKINSISESPTVDKQLIYYNLHLHEGYHGYYTGYIYTTGHYVTNIQVFQDD